jgi:hypothetical protein
MVGKCLLQRVERPVARLQTFDRRYVVSIGLHRQHQARSRRPAIDEDGACTADAMLAAEMRTG